MSSFSGKKPDDDRKEKSILLLLLLSQKQKIFRENVKRNFYLLLHI